MLNHKQLIFVFCVCYNYVICEYLDLREGKQCSWGNDTGICINAFNCLKTKTDIPMKTNVPICSYDGKIPIVCCTDCYTGIVYDFRDEVLDPYVGALWNYGPQAQNKFNEYLVKLDYPCKRYLNTTYAWSYDRWKKCYKRDISQSGSSDGIDFPRDPQLIHSVVLGYGEQLETAQWLCGGSIISESYILTSANCTITIFLGPVKFVGIGLLNGTGEPWRSYRVKRIIPYPLYRPSSKYHDIALLETATPIHFSEQVAPISLLGKAPKSSKPYRAVAWSELGHGKSLSETLKSGDNGASIITRDDTTCTYSILGVVSLGRVCGEVGGAALYTKVYYYVPWIQNIVWPKKDLSYTEIRKNKNTQDQKN